MKRSKKMFSRLTSFVHNAVEALAPEMTNLEQFRYHWKSVTQFFLDTTDERVSVENTTIPHHLEQMLLVLLQEELDNGISSHGPSMEFMLQHKLLETMQTLGRADCPPGMKRHVLVFFTNLLGKSKQQLLPHVNAHKPVNKLIRCCGEVKAAPTESEEVQFLLQVSSKLKQDSHLVNFFLEKPSSTENGSFSPLSPGMEREREKPEYSLIDALLALTKSEDSRVAIKACEGLLLVTSIPEDNAASVIVLYTGFCERMADQLAKLFKGLPAVIDPSEMNQLSATWGFDLEDQMSSSFPGKRQMIAFFSWLDYVNQLSVEAHPTVSQALAFAIRERYIITAIEPGLSQASEPCAITVTALLTRCLRLISSPLLAQVFASILLGTSNDPEIRNIQCPHKIRCLLIQRINHLSDQLAVETLRLFQALLQLPYQPIMDTLITRNFTKRNFINWSKARLIEEMLQSRNGTPSKHYSVPSGNKEEEILDRTNEDEHTNNDVTNLYTEECNKGSDSPCNTDNETTIMNSLEAADETLYQSALEDILTSDISNESKNNELIESFPDNINNCPIPNDTTNTHVNNDAEEASIIEIVIPEQASIKEQQKAYAAESEAVIEINGEHIPTDEKLISDNEVVLLKSLDVPEQGSIKEQQEMFLMDANSENESQDSLNDGIGDSNFQILLDSLEDTNIGSKSGKPFSKKRVEKVVNGFLLIFPDVLRTAEMVGDVGYDSYLRDAHKQCEQRAIQSFHYNWPASSSDVDYEDDNDNVFYEGTFLESILKRLQNIQDQPFDINLEITAIISLLCQFQHPYLHEFLMDTADISKESLLTPHRVLQEVCQDMKIRATRITNCPQLLLSMRKNLSLSPNESDSVPEESFLQAVIILEEFSKELAAIAFVTATANRSDNS